MSLIGNIFVANIVFNYLPFNEIGHIIVKYKYCVLVLGESAISIIYNQNNFYTFDPHSRDTCGFPDPNGTAKVLKFNNFTNLCSYIYKLSKYLCTESSELTPIKITKFKQMSSCETANNITPTQKNNNQSMLKLNTQITNDNQENKSNKNILTNNQISQYSTNTKKKCTKY